MNYEKSYVKSVAVTMYVPVFESFIYYIQEIDPKALKVKTSSNILKCIDLLLKKFKC